MTVIGTIVQKKISGTISKRNVSGAILHKKVTGSIASSGQSWSAYWKTLNKTFWVKPGSRSGLILQDSINPGVNNVTILPVCFSNTTTRNSRLIIPNDPGQTHSHTFDISTNYFTLAGWAKSEAASISENKVMFGKRGNDAGKYYIQYQTSGAVACGFKTATTDYYVISAATTYLTDGLWHHYLMEIDQVAKKMRFFIDGVQEGADVSWTGTIPAQLNSNFTIGGSKASTQTYCAASISEVMVLTRLTTPTEKANMQNDIYPTDCAGHWPLIGGVPYLYDQEYDADSPDSPFYEYDTSGNNNHLITDGKPSQKFYSKGSRHGLDKGYSLYRIQELGEIYIPYLDSGTPITDPPVSVGSVFVANFPGSATEYNMANAMLRMPLAQWDRSDVAMYNAASRRRSLLYAPYETYYFPNYYDSGNTKDWHVTELDNIRINRYCNEGYKGLNFVNISANTYSERTTFKDIASFETNKTGSDYSKIIIGIGDFVYTNDLIYSFCNEPIVIFGIDNGGERDYTELKPIFDAKGVKFTSYVNGSKVGGTDDATGAQLMTWDQIKLLKAAGYDIGTHGYEHLWIAQKTTAEITANFANDDAAFVANDMAIPRHHSYAGYSENGRVRSIIASYRDTGLHSGRGHPQYMDNYYNYQYIYSNSNRYRIHTTNIWIMDTPTGVANLAALKATVDDAIAKKAVLCLYTHSVNLVNESDWSITKMTDLLNYIVTTKGIRVLSMEEFYNEFGDRFVD